MGNLVDSECCSKRVKLLPTTNSTIARYENNRQNNDSLHSIQSNNDLEGQNKNNSASIQHQDTSIIGQLDKQQSDLAQTTDTQDNRQSQNKLLRKDSNQSAFDLTDNGNIIKGAIKTSQIRQSQQIKNDQSSNQVQDGTESLTHQNQNSQYKNFQFQGLLWSYHIQDETLETINLNIQSTDTSVIITCDEKELFGGKQKILEIPVSAFEEIYDKMYDISPLLLDINDEGANEFIDNAIAIKLSKSFLYSYFLQDYGQNSYDQLSSDQKLQLDKEIDYYIYLEQKMFTNNQSKSKQEIQKEQEINEILLQNLKLQSYILNKIIVFYCDEPLDKQEYLRFLKLMRDKKENWNQDLHEQIDNEIQKIDNMNKSLDI